MGKIISLEQSHTIVAAITTTAPWDEAIPSKVQEFITGPNKKMAGRYFIEWLNRGCIPLPIDNMIVDLDADPFCPEGWTVESHQKGGIRKFDKTTISPYLADGQKNGSCMVGNDLRAALVAQPVENANQLDWYLAHSDQIPKEWKGKLVFFWGTIYRNDGKLCVRCLRWCVGKWHSYYYWLSDVFASGNPAAVRIKPAA